MTEEDFNPEDPDFYDGICSHCSKLFGKEEPHFIAIHWESDGKTFMREVCHQCYIDLLKIINNRKTRPKFFEEDSINIIDFQNANIYRFKTTETRPLFGFLNKSMIDFSIQCYNESIQCNYDYDEVWGHGKTLEEKIRAYRNGTVFNGHPGDLFEGW